MLRDALEIVEGPVAIRWPKTTARNVPDDEVGCGLSARKVKSGSDICIVSVGKMLDAAEGAAEALEAAGISVTVWDARVVKPLDPRMIADAARHTLVITVEDGIRDGGAGAAVADAVAADALGDGRVGPPVRVLGTPCVYIPQGKPDAILRELGLDAEGISAEATKLLDLIRPS
jgi:1-deoxy-D-xylulose-5-phosphate synthase